jgi:hypothetical protein
MKTTFMTWSWAPANTEQTEKAIAFMSERHTFNGASIEMVKALFEATGTLDAAVETGARYFRLERPNSWHNHPDHYTLVADFYNPSTNFAEELIGIFGEPSRHEFTEEVA